MELEVISEKALPQTTKSGLISYCPTMDLVALGSVDEQVLLYRLNGQRVYGAAQRGSSLKIEGMQWKPNGNLPSQPKAGKSNTFAGQLLAIAWSDGIVRLVGANSSKTVHEIPISQKNASTVTCIGWGSCFTGKPGTDGSDNQEKSWIDAIGQTSVLREKSTVLNLPRDLSLIDVESSMPQLSVLPVGGIS